MNDYRIILVEFPMTDKPEVKIRPALMLNSNQNEFQQFQSAYLTTNNKYNNYNDVKISSNHKDFNLTKLNQSTTIRLSKIETFDPSEVKGLLGMLPEDLILKIKKYY